VGIDPILLVHRIARHCNCGTHRPPSTVTLPYLARPDPSSTFLLSFTLYPVRSSACNCNCNCNCVVIKSKSIQFNSVLPLIDRAKVLSQVKSSQLYRDSIHQSINPLRIQYNPLQYNTNTIHQSINQSWNPPHPLNILTMMIV
jgi:hypothetical protein